QFDCTLYCSFFFFQAEDGIRDFHVTGVQTCALPIYDRVLRQAIEARPLDRVDDLAAVLAHRVQRVMDTTAPERPAQSWQDRAARSEERRVGKEGRSRRSPCR